MVKYDENLIKQEQKNIDGICLEIGKKYVAEHKDSPDPEYAGFMDKIAACEERIDAHKKAVLKANGLQLCPKCGEEIPLRSFFCNICGAKLDGQQADEEAAGEPGSDEPAEEPVPEEPAEELPAEAQEPAPNEKTPAPAVCAACGAALEPDCMFCIECGARVETKPDTPAVVSDRFCDECGYHVTESDAVFCNNCGKRLPDSPRFLYSHSAPAGKTCPNCGFHTDEADVLFCIECGTKLP